jgi:hypothetical protein
MLVQGKSEIQSMGLSELRMIGAMAYWAEGSKTLDSVVKFTNHRPRFNTLDGSVASRSVQCSS